MKIAMPARVAAVLVAGALLAAGCGDGNTSGPSTGPYEPEPTAPADDEMTLTQSATCPSQGDEWEVAKLYIEHNATDVDTGVHGFFGGEAWAELCIWDPDGNQIFLVDPQAQLGDLTVADFFFESREPPGDEYSVDDLLADFPEGTYTVGGTDFEGVARFGEATFTHDIPVEPEITAPALVEDPEDTSDTVVPDGDLLVTWEPVTETLAGEAVAITGYEVIITMEEFEDPDGLSHPIYDVHVPPDFTELMVPDAFLLPDTVYELEVLALERSGNQTIALGFFATA